MRERAVGELLAVEAEQRPGEAADAEQQRGSPAGSSATVPPARSPSSLSLARRGRRCQTIAPIAAAIASTATIGISVAIWVRRASASRLSDRCCFGLCRGASAP